MKIIGIIPARLASTRFPGKVLVEIAGKPMIQHVWEQAKKSKKLNDLIIACDDVRIKAVAESFNANVVMTSPKHPSGSDRIAEAIKNIKCDIVINIQADEPLINPAVIDSLAKVFDGKKAKNISMATVIKKVHNVEDLNNPNVVKVVVDINNTALYFSRSRIPYERNAMELSYYKHLGIYAYRKEFLLKFIKMPKSGLEQIEGLEQLRALEAGYKIQTIVTDYETIGVDTKDDLEKIEKLIQR